MPPYATADEQNANFTILGHFLRSLWVKTVSDCSTSLQNESRTDLRNSETWKNHKYSTRRPSLLDAHEQEYRWVEGAWKLVTVELTNSLLRIRVGTCIMAYRSHDE
jgi:hypothetical protein